MSDQAASRNGLILSLNSGSSSLKISLYRLSSSTSPKSDPVKLILTSSISSISSSPTFSFSVLDKSASSSNTRTVKNEPTENKVKDHASAFVHFLDYLKDEASIDRAQIVHVCHRIVHGGDYYEPIVITRESYHHIENLSDLAPLHNGAALSVIKSAIAELKHANSIAYFDTSFHHDMPHHISSYAINPKIAKSKGLRKYGFHGLSYAFILRAVAQHLQKDVSQTNLIVMHLGSGASICAIKDGKSLDTSMGLTPVSGLPGATRSGDIDPTLPFHYTHNAAKISHQKAGAVPVGVTEAEEILNTQSGWKAIVGTTDFSQIVSQLSSSPEAKLAFDLFLDRIIHYVGAYYLKLGGKVDALVFSGGIGEKSVDLRREVARKCECIGIVVDEGKNEGADDVEGDMVEITGSDGEGDTREGKATRVLVCRTDEQLEMARECALEPKFWE